MKRTTLFFALAPACLALTLTACGGAGRRGVSKSHPPELPAQSAAPAQQAAQGISYLTISLPREVQWQQGQDQQRGVTEWVLQGHTSQNSPARVVYQRISPAQPAQQLANQVLNPLGQCADRYVNTFVGTSKYPRQANIEAICSRLGQSRIGLISYVSIFSDAQANHLIMTEVRTPPSAKVGIYDQKNAALQKQVEAVNNLAALLRRTMQSVRVCDANRRCI